MKKLFACLLTLCMCTMVAPMGIFTAKADTLTEGFYTYKVVNNKATITDVWGTINGDITIPSSFGEYPVVGIGDNAFDTCANLTGVVIPEGVTSIGKAAFVYCNNIENITIPNSVTSIGEEAFAWCQKLTEVELPNSITEINETTFAVCDKLTNVIIPNSVKKIGASAFAGCRSLTEINIPSGVTTIDEEAFASCFQLKKVTIPNSVISIGAGAFNYCQSLTDVTIYSTNCQFKENSGFNANQVIYGIRGSTAQTLANNIGAEFVPHNHVYNITTCGSYTVCTICKNKGFIQEHSFFECYGTCELCGKRIQEDQHGYLVTTQKATFKKDGSIKKECCYCSKTTATKIKKVKSVKLSTTAYNYNGKAKKPTVTVKDSAGQKLKKDKDYTLSYSKGRKKVGTYKVTVKLKGNYSGTKTLTFKINPPKTSLKKLTAAKKSLKVSFSKKTKEVSGYEIQYSTSKKFKSAKKITVKKAKATSATIKKLKSKKTYYVRVRTYKKVSGKKYYSSWCAYKSKKTK